MSIKNIILAMSSTLVASGTMAAPIATTPVSKPTAPAVSAVKVAPPSAPARANVNLNVYAEPILSANIIEAIQPDEELIPIFRQGEWIKVGDPRNGKVGWINHQQYKQAMNSWYQPNVQAVYIRGERDKNGKQQMNIVAYSNGKKLDDKAAEALYKQIQADQQRDLQMMRETRQQMDAFFWRQSRILDQEGGSILDEDLMPPAALEFGVTKSDKQSGKKDVYPAVVPPTPVKK